MTIKSEARIHDEELIREMIAGLDEETAVDLWNARCEDLEYVDDIIYSMDEFDELFYGLSPLQLLEEVRGNNFDIRDNWFWISIYGPKSAEYPVTEEKGPVVLSELVEWVYENLDKAENTSARLEIESLDLECMNDEDE